LTHSCFTDLELRYEVVLSYQFDAKEVHCQVLLLFKMMKNKKFKRNDLQKVVFSYLEMIDDSRKRWNHRRCCVVGTRQVVDWKNSPKTPSVMNLWFYNEPVYKNWKKYDDQFWKQNFRIEGFIINHHPEVLFLKYESKKLQLQMLSAKVITQRNSI
jgi:hypothetical protein